ncbi:hypothetical protein FA15DRAFT_674624 [Coprinopsis marcescibilis]|uniref:FHA domain-containing protein n=1 Tax=Coprinopsis marcescibilis TaxID=230819 RepID=A0A5C3KGU2_COPMA|nr:hypothetical protein FA15DRAFT_674624 [Coprinopsis marcescibilis]
MSMPPDEEIEWLATVPAPKPNIHRPVTGIALTVEKADDVNEVALRLVFQRDKHCVVPIGRRPGDGSSRTSGVVPGSSALFRCAVVSRSHAKIMFSDSGLVYLIDLNSHHGTHLRKAGHEQSIRLAPKAAMALSDGDVITLGKTVGRNEGCVRPVVVRVELQRHSSVSTNTNSTSTSSLPLPLSSSSSFKPLIVPSPASDKSSSGRYGVYDEGSSSSGLSSSSSSSSSDEMYDSEIEEIEPPSSVAAQPRTTDHPLSAQASLQSSTGGAMSPDADVFPLWFKGFMPNLTPSETTLPPLLSLDTMGMGNPWAFLPTLPSLKDITGDGVNHLISISNADGGPGVSSTGSANVPNFGNPEQQQQHKSRSHSPMDLASPASDGDEPISIVGGWPLSRDEANESQSRSRSRSPPLADFTLDVQPLPAFGVDQQLGGVVADEDRRTELDGEHSEESVEAKSAEPELALEAEVEAVELKARSPCVVLISRESTPAASTPATDDNLEDAYDLDSSESACDEDEDDESIVEDYDDDEDGEGEDESEGEDEGEDMDDEAEQSPSPVALSATSGPSPGSTGKDVPACSWPQQEIKDTVAKIQADVTKLHAHRRKYRSRFNANVHTMAGKIAEYDSRMSELSLQQASLTTKVQAVEKVQRELMEEWDPTGHLAEMQEQLEGLVYVDVPDLQSQVDGIDEEMGEFVKEVREGRIGKGSNGEGEGNEKDVEEVREKAGAVIEKVKDEIAVLQGLIEDMKELRTKAQQEIEGAVKDVRGMRESALAKLDLDQEMHDPIPIATLKRKRDEFALAGEDSEQSSDSDASAEVVFSRPAGDSDDLIGISRSSTREVLDVPGRVTLSDCLGWIDECDVLTRHAESKAGLGGELRERGRGAAAVEMLDVGSDEERPRKRKRVGRIASVVAHTATAITLGAVATWSALAFS